MQILVTNDDGWHALGIQVLAEELSRIGTVTVVAPDQERSATGHAITVHRPLRVEEVRFPVPDVTAYSVNGTPSDCVKLGVDAVLEAPPQIVVSGINRGPNLGTDILYSGTVSGAMEGIILGIPSIAVSLATFDHGDYRFAAKFAARLVMDMAKHGLPPNTLLNVNVPSIEIQEVVGVKVTRLGTRRWHKVFDRRTDPRGKVYYWMAGEVLDTDEDPETDTAAIRNNLVSVTPIHYDLTNRQVIPTLNDWGLSIDGIEINAVREE